MKKLFFIFSLLLLLGSHNLKAQDDNAFELEFIKLEQFYATGKYIEAYNKSKRIVKRIHKKEEYPQYLIAAEALTLKYQKALGLQMGSTFQLTRLNSQFDSSSASLTDSCQIITQTALASCGLLHAHYSFASKHLKSISEDTLLTSNTHWKKYLSELELSILTDMMDYQQAETKTNNLLADTGFFTPTHPIKKDKKQLKERNEFRKLLLIIQAELALKKGDLTTADSLFTRNYDLKLGSKKSYLYVRNWLGATQTKVALADQNAGYEFKKIRFKFANNIHYAIPNQFYLSIFMEDIKANIALENYSRFDKAVTQYQREVAKNYTKKSTHQFTAGYLQYMDRLGKGRYKSFEKNLQKINVKRSLYFDSTDAGQIPFLTYYAKAQIGVFNFVAAEHTYEQIQHITLANNDSNSALAYNAHLGLASFWVKYTNRYLEADSIFKAYYDPFVRQQLHSSHKLYQQYLANYALLDQKLDRYDSAIAKWEEFNALIVTKYGKNSIQNAEGLTQLAKARMQKGQFYQAEMHLYEAKEILENLKLTKSISYVITLQSIGELMAINGNLPQAEKTLNEASEAAKRFENVNPFLRTNTQQSLADYMYEIGNYDASLKITQNNLKLTQQSLGYQHESLIGKYENLAKIYLTQGNLILAEQVTDSAIKVAAHVYGTNAIRCLKSKALLAKVYFEMGDYDRSNDMFTDIITIYENDQNSSSAFLAELLIEQTKAQVNLHFDSQDLIDQLNKASDIVIANTSDQHPHLAQIMEQKAFIYMLNKNYKEALIQLQAANFIYLASYGSNHYKTADNQVNLGDLYYEEGKYAKAHLIYGQALTIYQKIFSPKHPKYARTIGKIGTTFYAQKNYSEAYNKLTESTTTYLSHIKNFFPSLTEQQKSKYWNSVRPDFEVYKSLAIHYAQTNPTVLSHLYNQQLATKAILLNSTVKMRERIFTYGSEDLKEKFFRWQTLNTQYIQLLALPLDQQDSLQTQIADTKYELHKLEKDLNQSVEGFEENVNTKHISWNTVKSQLDPNQIAIEIIRANYFDSQVTDSSIYIALLVDKEARNSPHMVIIANGNDLEQKHYPYYTNAMREKKPDLNSYTYFWEPLEAYTKGKSDIFLSSDGVYNLVNPETFSPSANTYLIENTHFHFVSTTKKLLVATSIPNTGPTKTAVLMGDPAFGDFATGDFGALPGAATEVENIANTLTKSGWNVDTFIGQKATEDVLTSANSPTVLHIATHGYFLPQPSTPSKTARFKLSAYKQPLLRSGLLLSNSGAIYTPDNVYNFNSAPGILTAYEAMNLNLDQTQLVFLSACETGKGELVSGEGVYGLQRAFLIAGADNVVMTLFKVDDQVTQLLAQTFYANWLNGNSKSEALMNAKREVAKTYPHPFYWGAFKLTGRI